MRVLGDLCKKGVMTRMSLVRRGIILLNKEVASLSSMVSQKEEMSKVEHSRHHK